MKAIVSLVLLLGIMNIARCQEGLELPRVDSENNILIFSSQDHVKAVAGYLEKLLAADPLGFKQASAEGISDESADASSEQGTKNGEEGLAEFEAKLGFRSLRAELQSKVDEWLRSDGDNLRTEPADSHIQSAAHRALLNSFFEIQVGNAYHKLSPSGQQEFKTLDELMKARQDAGTSQDPSAIRKLQPYLCRTFVFNQGYKYCSDNKRRVKYIIGHYWFFGYYATATTLCQKKGLFGWWWPVLCYNNASVYGYTSAPAVINGVYQLNRCEKQLAFNTAGWTAYGWFFVIVHNYGVISMTKSGWVKGRHYSACCPGYFYTQLIF